jgi:deoxyribodipyrimidine photo-lyase
MSYNTGIFIFTRDLRLEDNTTLLKALSECKEVLPIFIFNPDQITDKNKYKSNNSIQFMIESLEELNKELNQMSSRLFYFYGQPDEVINKICKEDKSVDSIYMNKDYTQFAKKREDSINNICKKLNVNFTSLEDYMVTGVDKVFKSDGKPYLKFTPYFRVASKVSVEKPKNNNAKNYVKKTNKYDCEYKKDIHDFYEENKNIFVRGGRTNALNILKQIKSHQEYNTDREIPSLNSGTTHLSAYLKFNVISIREVYEYFKKYLTKSNKLFTQLYWRDFYMQIMYHFNPIKSNRKYDIDWINNSVWIKKWKNGQTGIPIIDAAMRQMNVSGWMHNRCRMIVSNFFIKIMGCDWTIGEQYFAEMLVDYDVYNNNGGWLWSASSLSGFDFSLDSQPYFRVFSPWRQADTYDYNCEYIKKWIPELKDVPIKDILKWNEKWEEHKKTKYPKPMIEDIQQEFKKTLKLLK